MGKIMQNTCVSYGVFEGIHRGHVNVVEETVKLAKERGLSSVVISCKKEGNVLSTEEEKEYFFKEMGVEKFVSCDCKDMTDKDIVRDILVDKYGANVIVIGENSSRLEEVKAAAESCGIDVVTCDTVKDIDGNVITTEAIKAAFDDSDFDKMYELCGHSYIMIGSVEHGKALGRTVGMPTANLGVVDYKLKPPSGVYATNVRIDDESFKAMTNIGKRPSVDNYDYVTIEAFILDFSRDIYGKKIILGVRHFVRGVQKFDCLEDVQKQVQKDIEKVRELL